MVRIEQQGIQPDADHEWFMWCCWIASLMVLLQPFVGSLEGARPSGTPMTCSVYGGSSLEISSNETKAARLIRNSLNSNGDAPGLRLICLVVRAFEQLLSAGSMVVILSSTP